MSKHKSAEQKLHISAQLRSGNKSMQKKAAQNVDTVHPGPPKGTNSNNQFR
jgi:hypothetical protein